MTERRSILSCAKSHWREGLRERATKALLSGPCLALLTFLVYLKTLAPGVSGFDSGELVTGAFTLGIIHPPGYPLYLLLGRLFAFLPLGSVAYSLNLMSAVFASLTVLLLHRFIHRLTRSRLLAWTAAGMFAASYYFWQMAVVAEVYTLHTFFLAIELNLLLAWERSRRGRLLAAFALCYGLSLANSTSGVLFLPGLAWFLLKGRGWRREDWRQAVGLAALFLLGLTVYLYLPLRAAGQPPINYVEEYPGVDLTTPAGMWWMISGQAYRFFAFGYAWSEMPREAARFVGWLWRSTLGVGFLLGLLGWFRLWGKSRKKAVWLGLIFAGNVLMFMNYRVIDKDTMFLPAYLVWGVVSAFGLGALLEWAGSSAVRGAMLPAARVALKVLPIALVVLAVAVNLPWADMSGAVGPMTFAREVLSTAEPDAIVFAQWSPAVVLEYFQVVEGQRPDLMIHNRSRSGVAQYYALWKQGRPPEEILASLQQAELDLVRRHIGRRPVYVVEYDPLFEEEFEYLPEGNYFRLAPALETERSL